MHEVLVNRLGGLSLPRKSVVKLTDHPDMTLDVYRGRKTITQQQHITVEESASVQWVKFLIDSRLMGTSLIFVCLPIWGQCLGANSCC